MTTAPTSTRNRRTMLLALAALAGATRVARAQSRLPLRISTPAVPDDWHARMWTVLKEDLEQSSAGQFEVQIHLNASLFKQGAEPVAMARGNLEMTSMSAFDIAKIVPEFSIFTAGYVIRDARHLMQVFQGPIGEELFRLVSEKMEVTVLAPIYYGTRQLGLRETRSVKTPADLKGLKLRMPGSKEWLFLGAALGAAPAPLAFGEVYLGLKTGTIDAQDNPLPTVRSAKFYEVLKQLVLTGHLVESLFICVSNRLWNGLGSQQKAALRHAALAAASYNNENRIADERTLPDFFRAQGLTISTPDLPAFQSAVRRAYLESEYARLWPKGLLERINATR